MADASPTRACGAAACCAGEVPEDQHTQDEDRKAEGASGVPVRARWPLSAASSTERRDASFRAISRGAQAPSAFNNAVWFLVQSKYLAWLLAAPVLIALLRSGRRTVRVAGLALVALAFPSTAQYLSYQFREGSLQRLAPEFEQIRIALERAALPGDVVYARPPFGAAIVTLTRIRSPVYTVFPWSRVPPGELELRVADYRAFWNAWTEGELRSDIVARRSIRFVLDDSAETGAGSEPAGVRLIDASGRFRLYEVGAEVSARRAPKPERSSPTARVASIDIADARKIPGGS